METTRIKLMMTDGNVTEIDVAEILEVDGKPFTSIDDVDSRFDSLIDQLNHTNGRLDTLQSLMQSCLSSTAGK